MPIQPLPSGTVLNNRYKIISHVGGGGFGFIYQAEDLFFQNRKRAVKENQDTDNASITQFQLEAAILTELNHPNLVRVIDHFVTTQGQYLVMDYVEGMDLFDKVNSQNGPLPEDQVIEWMMQICDALIYIHSQNPPIIHRDIKPANIRINQQNQAILVDFGLAKMGGTLKSAKALTPGYAPCEQYGNAPSDARTDVYALGATMYTLLTGTVPTTSTDRLMGLAFQTPRQINLTVSPKTEQAILIAMEVKPEDRWQNVQDFKNALSSSLAGGYAHGRQLNQGEVIDKRYRVAKFLSYDGSFARIYKVWDLHLEHACLLQENLDHSTEGEKQFKEQGKILSKLHHANIVRYLDYLEIPGRGQYMVFEYTDGENLDTIISRKGPLPEGEAIKYISQICDALDYIHQKTPPIIHRDIQPAKITITSGGTAILTGFTIVKAGSFNMITAAGAQATIPGFSPPEQYGQSHTDSRSDIYALGATLYNLLTDVVPPESVYRGTGTRLDSPGRLKPGVSSHVDAAIVKALELNPADRFQTAAEFRRALETVQPVEQSTTTIGKQGTVQQTQSQTTLQQPPISGGRVAAFPRWIFPSLAAVAGLMLVAWLAFSVIIPAAQRSIAAAEVDRTARAQTAAVQATRNALTAVAAAWTATPSRTATPIHTATPTITPTPTLGIGSTRVSEVDGMVMVYVPAGEFEMGSEDGWNDEKPVHTVYLDGYWMDRTEVSVGMYNLCVAAGSCTSTDDTAGDDYPVVLGWSNWSKANDYCQWAGRRLPSEAEWEKAARGTDGRTYPWGEGATCDKANYWPCRKERTKVGSYPDGASPYGALDMSGNLWEFVADWYSSTYYGSSPYRSPTGPTSGDYHVIRGGSWYYAGYFIRSSNRNYDYYYDYYYSSVGFRCARSE